MHSPVVSVVMPVRNCAQFIDAAIRSIRAQTLSDLELIIVDDGSSDASAAIAARHAAVDERIRLLTLPPSGVAVALNHGLVAARCHYVALSGAADIARSERLARQVEVLENKPSVALVGAACEIVDVTGVVIRRIEVPTTPREIATVMHSAAMMRREVALRSGGWQSVASDPEYDLWLRLSQGHELANLSEVLVQVRR